MTTPVARFCLLLGAALLTSSDGGASVSPAEQEIRRLEQGLNDTYAANDLPKYFSYYADDLVAFFPAGRSTLAPYRRSWTESVTAGDRVVWSRPADMQVRFGPSGDTAIASYRLDVRMRLRDGRISDERLEEINVWLRRNGRWQVTHLHCSAARPAQ